MKNPLQVDSQVTFPSLMKSLTAGFDAISNHVWLVLFTLVLDGVLWFGPRLRIASLFEEIFLKPDMLAVIGNPELLDSVRETIAGFNLLSLLRTFPIGVPSLMVGRAPLQTPLGDPLTVDISSSSLLIILWAILSLVGIIVGTLYFSLVAQVVKNGQVSWQDLFIQFTRNIFQIILLTLSLILILVVISFPISCMMSFAMLGGLGFEQVTLIFVMVIFVLYLWLLLPMVFSPHAIILNQQKAWGAIKNSFRISRKTLPTSFVLIIVVFLVSEGMGILWNIPPDSSWLTLVGILGHAFITTSLLASTFFYFRDANQWVLHLEEESKNSPKRIA